MKRWKWAAILLAGLLILGATILASHEAGVVDGIRWCNDLRANRLPDGAAPP